MSLEEEVETISIASVPIHVERAIEWVKYIYYVLHSVIPISLHAQFNLVLFVAYILTNFLPALVQ